MGAQCHFAHGKEEVRNAQDPLPDHTPYIHDQKIAILNHIGLACLSESPVIKKQLKELGNQGLIRALEAVFATIDSAARCRD